MARTSGSDGDGTHSHPDYAYFLAAGLSPEDAECLISAQVSREAAGRYPGYAVNFVSAATYHGLDDINGRLLAANGDADEAWETWAKADTDKHPDYHDFLAEFLAEGLSPEDAELLISAQVSPDAAVNFHDVADFVRAATYHGLDDINGRLLAANGDADEAWETWAKHDWDSHPDYAYFLESGFDREDAYLLLFEHVSREAARLGPGSVCGFLSAASYHSLDDINGRLLAANGDGYQAWETWAEEENALNRLAEEEEE